MGTLDEGQFTLTTTRQSKQSVTSMKSRKTSVTTVQGHVELVGGALTDEKSLLHSVAEGARENSDKRMLTYEEEGFQNDDDSLGIFSEAPDVSVSETTEMGPDGRVVTKKVSVCSIRKVSIN